MINGETGRLRKMEDYGKLPESFAPDQDPNDVYRSDQVYW